MSAVRVRVSVKGSSVAHDLALQVESNGQVHRLGVLAGHPRTDSAVVVPLPPGAAPLVGVAVLDVRLESATFLQGAARVAVAPDTTALALVVEDAVHRALDVYGHHAWRAWLQRCWGAGFAHGDELAQLRVTAGPVIDPDNNVSADTLLTAAVEAGWILRGAHRPTVSQRAFHRMSDPSPRPCQYGYSPNRASDVAVAYLAEAR